MIAHALQGQKRRKGIGRMNQTTSCNYELLVAAIIKQAITDYKLAVKNSSNNRKSIPTCKEVERFFKSPWGEYLCLGHNIDIFEKLLKETEKKNLSDSIE